MKDRVDLRLTSSPGSKLYEVLSYLQQGDHLVGDARTMATQAISAFWLPFALQSRGASPEVVQQAANECRLLLQRQQYWLNQAFGESLVAATPIVAPEPIAPPRMLDYRNDEEENDYDASDFSGAIDGNYLLDDE